jgi:biotin carboxyl carrier protein
MARELLIRSSRRVSQGDSLINQRTNDIFSAAGAQRLPASWGTDTSRYTTSSTTLLWGHGTVGTMRQPFGWSVTTRGGQRKGAIRLGSAIFGKNDNYSEMHNVSQEHAKDGDHVFAPVPGKVKKIYAKKSDRIDKDQVIAIIESMKMEFEVRAPKQGTIEDVAVNVDDQVEADSLLITWQKL